VEQHLPILNLAIVNRGEAAMRCLRTVKSYRALTGSKLQAIALFTEVDREAPFVRHADRAVQLPIKTTAVGSYLDHDLLIEVFKREQIDAVWPGWGFVAESPHFVARLAQENIRFLGPSAETMIALGDKIASKQLAEQLSVPVTAWSGGVVREEQHAREVAKAIGFPLVIKASAGGGGRGVRIVREESMLISAFISAASEAKTAFGDDRLFLEKMVQGGRHIEVQIVADQHGTVWALGCRDCSVQRRHQKVLEEAPPVGLAPHVLEELKNCAKKLTSKVQYFGVGTVEFLVQGTSFFFLEMNPRLQVEHGLTELLTGVDLVEWQIRIAQGERLPEICPESRGFALEARVCAEDPDAGFLPSPGLITRFDPPLGPRIRVDTGVVPGSRVPAEFDSLIAKVIATGPTREGTRACLESGLLDFDLVIEGGASNRGYLLDILRAKDYQNGQVDTQWLDRWNTQRQVGSHFGSEALVLCSILAYQSAWRTLRHAFFADTSNITNDKIPASTGREIELSAYGETYRVQVYSIGSWRYRILMGDQVVTAQLADAGNNRARLQVGEQNLRVLYDLSDAQIRVEIEGYSHVFARQSAGQVRAGAPSVVVAIQVKPGDVVTSGQPLGLLEAMKMEIGFSAPITGIIREVKARKGQQVAAGDVLLIIDPTEQEPQSDVVTRPRLDLPTEQDAFASLFVDAQGNAIIEPDLMALHQADPAFRLQALRAVCEEIRRILVGFDVFPQRLESLISFLEAPVPQGISEEFREQLAEVRQHLDVFADTEQLFVRTRKSARLDEPQASNNARFRQYVRRSRAEGAGLPPEFVSQLKKALAHYGVDSLDHNDSLERAILRMLATQLEGDARQRLLMAVLRRLIALSQVGLDLGKDSSLRETLIRIAEMRGQISNALADTVIDAAYTIFQRPRASRLLGQTMDRAQEWLTSSEANEHVPTEEILYDLALTPTLLFGQVIHELFRVHQSRYPIALAAYVRRIYSPRTPISYHAKNHNHRWVEHLTFSQNFQLKSTLADPDDILSAFQLLTLESKNEVFSAFEVVVPVQDIAVHKQIAETIREQQIQECPCQRLTISLISAHQGSWYLTWERQADGSMKMLDLYGLHPEIAQRIDFQRLSLFQLERITATEGIYCFHGRSRTVPDDERMFVLAEVRCQPSVTGFEPENYLPIFESIFYEATRTLRVTLGQRDPQRRLQWNRIIIFFGHEVFFDKVRTEGFTRRLLPATRHLGIERTLVRLPVRDPQNPEKPAVEKEIVIYNTARSRIEMVWRDPHRLPLIPVGTYERRVVAARRRGLVYPYEIIRMLTQPSNEDEPQESVSTTHGRPSQQELPRGIFEEYDLDPSSTKPLAMSVAGREPGKNQSAIVFGIISTPFSHCPEIKRVIILSDPTRDMGALSSPECDRVVAALDLAEKLQVPVEWVAVSAGARIAMDSGTENLDATARVVRKIVEFTQNNGVIHLIVAGVNVGAQSYWDALATMLMHTRGILVMTPQASMVLTGKAALMASGSIAAEDEVAIGGYERVMGPNGQAQYYADDLDAAFAILYQHYRFSYVFPGELRPRRLPSYDPIDRDLGSYPYINGEGSAFQTVGELFDPKTNPGRKKPFSMRALMRSVMDQDGEKLERWQAHMGAETTIVWDTQLGGYPVCLIGIESQNVPRWGYRPLDGPVEWNGGTLFPQASKKVARALNAVSGNRPAVILANLSGFDGSPESMRRWQLEYGAEIARAVVNFQGPIVFLVVSRYHGGAYVVFSRELNPNLRSLAVEGSYASVIGGGPAASVVFPREVRVRVSKDPRIASLREKLISNPTHADRAAFERLRRDITLEKRAEIAAEFDSIHSVQRAKEVGSLEDIIPANLIRPTLISAIRDTETN
jgi:acetyl/propionyl-CoA carboxylase alpha subunit/acetyl-CoA carboxylase carboxyltransferase component